MNRRHVISVIVATCLAGCGWSQDRRDLEGEAAPGNTSEDEQTPEPLESEPGETLIERDDEDLLLPAEQFLEEWANLDGWEEKNIVSTHPCLKFEYLEEGGTTRGCEYCVILADDEAGAVDEFETFASLSENKQPERARGAFLEEQEMPVQIGDDSAVYFSSQEISRYNERRLASRGRVVYRDKNVVGTVDYSEETWVNSDFEPRTVRDVAELAALMHGYWRED